MSRTVLQGKGRTSPSAFLHLSDDQCPLILVIMSTAANTFHVLRSGLRSRIVTASLLCTIVLFYIGLVHRETIWDGSKFSDLSRDEPISSLRSDTSGIQDGLHDIFNETLGVSVTHDLPVYCQTDCFHPLQFEKIFVISLPDRTDKQDTISLQARLSNISFDFVTGIDGSKIPAKALPYACTLYPFQHSYVLTSLLDDGPG